ncbi:hypothetical protein DEM34_08870 [Spiribacter halobius]|uniref:Sel1 repeat family protein n=2 Tax=Sediminicurvatus halobius TaxID=2182432 RepID=A0A2U2N2U1_9GAMM|nr:hypothetical protein DEM34_08870 [Spiribacter halobius]
MDRPPHSRATVVRSEPRIRGPGANTQIGAKLLGSQWAGPRAHRFSTASVQTQRADTTPPRISGFARPRPIATSRLRAIATRVVSTAGQPLRLALLVLGLACAPLAAAAPLEEAIAAYEAGDYEQAIPMLQEAAESGDASAMYWLGQAYDYGHGVPTDPDRALDLYWDAAEQGLPEAQAAIAYSFDEGIGLPLDDAEAIRWYRKAAEGGEVPSQRALGLMYAAGEGVERDFEEAARWYRRAAENGDAVAARLMAEIHYRGSGPFAIDHERAAEWFYRAARQGEARAQYGLYVLYGQGLGVPHDEMTAYTWALFAARQGSEWGRKAWEGADWFLNEHQQRDIERRVEAGVMPSLTND